MSLDRGMNGDIHFNDALNTMSKSSVVDMSVLYGSGDIDTPSIGAKPLRSHLSLGWW